MTVRPSKRNLFLFTLLLQIPSTFLLQGQPFYAKERFGWSAVPTTLLQALLGLCVAGGAYTGGQVAHRRYPRLSMRAGLIGCMASALIGWTGAAQKSAPLFVLGMALFAFSQALVWPALEATMMYREPHARVQNFVAYFNLIWSFGAATAFLSATPLMHAYGLNVFFVLPILLYVGNLLFLRFAVPRYESRLIAVTAGDSDPTSLPAESVEIEEEAKSLTPAQRAAYRRLGWLSNPMAFIATSVIIAYSPTIQARLGLSFGAASAWCSLWFYARALAFELLRRWTWWHYRWAFLCLTFSGMMLSFAGIMLATSLGLLLAAQLLFGLCIGLMYQSSLFYSMAGSDAQGEHGSFHELVIGLGMGFGPLLAYAGARLSPNSPLAPVALVLTFLLLGLSVLLLLGRRIEGS